MTDGTVLTVDFFFYTPHRTHADALAAALQAEGLAVEISPTRTLWIFKAWWIRTVETRAWTRALLDERTEHYLQLGDAYEVLFDGCGAQMP